MSSLNDKTPVFSIQSKLWLVSFGDLLTLLLTFFVMTIAISGKGATEDTDKTTLTPKNPAEVVEHQRQAEIFVLSGTKIATYPYRTEVREIGLREIDFNTEADELTQDAKKRLRQVLTTRKDVLSPVRLEVCGGLGGYATEVSWFKSIGRALFVSSQLFDAGIPKALLEVRPLGPHCSLLNQAGKSEALVGKIKI
ncbi:MAG: hypothetical protein KDD56_02060 [Bdellovibrionales bacterium]|nr:hypothetical protein [Bdellovibrionales bacterium]